MKSIPVDQTRILLQGIATAPKMTREGAQKTNSDNQLLWTVQALVQSHDGLGKAELLEVTVPGAASPSFQPMTALEFNQLVARPYEFNGRSGVSFSAVSVRSVAPKAS